MSKMRGLGKGLGELLPDAMEIEPGTAGVLREVSITLIDNDKSQPRKNFDPEKLNELAQSIRVHGIMQPITAIESGGRYKIVAGERRFRAAKIAGLEKVPVHIKAYTDRDALELSLIENIQREDLNPMEQAAALKRLTVEYGLKQEEVADRVGKSRSAIANLMRLLSLPQGVQQRVAADTLSAGHARCLLPLKDEARIEAAARLIENRELSVRQAEKLVKDMLDETAKKPTKKEKTPVEIARAQDELSRALSTKVRITGDLEKGKISIAYYDKDQLESLFEYLRAAQQ